MEIDKTEKQITTASGIPLRKVYTQKDIADLDSKRDLGSPGAEPFTRGVYPEMYLSSLWRIRQLTGHGSVEDQHERIKYALELGQPAVSVLYDQSTACLYDVDHPEVVSRIDDVGLWGAPLSSLKDFEILFKDIPLDKIYAAVMGLPQSMPFSNGCYFALAENMGIPLSRLTGTCNEDMCTAYLAGTYPDIPAPRYGLRLAGDMIEFCVENIPRWTIASYSGYNIRECGINAYQEIAIVLANAAAFIDEVLSRKRLKVDDFANGLAATHLSGDRDFFEEIAKYRAIRRMWCRMLKERYHAQDPKSMKLRIHVQTAGSSLTYQQPMNNIVRVAYQVLAAALGDVQSMAAAGYDEAFCCPSEEAALLAIRTQQIAQYETGIANVVDPLAGSYYIENLTNEIEERAWDYFKKIEQEGGFITCLESGWLRRELMREFLQEEKKIQTGEKKVVGINCFQMDKEPYRISTFRTGSSVGEEQIARLQKLRRERDNQKVKVALDELKRAAQKGDNVMRPSIDAMKAYVTVGEIGQVWREVFGVWNAYTLR